METSLLLARILGPMYLVFGISLLFNSEYILKVYRDVLKEDSFLFASASLSLVAGLFLVNVHNLWVADWPVVITLIAWIAILKGAGLLLVPTQFKKLLERRVNRGVTNVSLVFALVLGTVLTYVAYF